MKILVLDDDKILAMILSDHLTERGHRVVPVYDGNLGSIFCQQKYFDVVVTDLILPEGNGLDFLERLRQKNRTSRAIIITGFPELLAEESARLERLDVEAVIEKPFSFSQVDAAVERSQ